MEKSSIEKRTHRNGAQQRAKKGIRSLWREPFFFAAMLVSASVQTWFSWGKYYAAGDSGFFLQGLSGITRAWGYDASGTGSSSQFASRMFESLLNEAVGAGGEYGWLAQRIYYTIIMLALVGSGYWLMRNIKVGKPAAAVGSLVPFLSAFNITTLPNLLPVMTMTVMFLLMGMAARLQRGDKVHMIVPLVVAAWCASISRNPPLLVLVCAVVVCAAVVALRKPTKKKLVEVLKLSFVMLAGSLFWLIPVVLHYGTGTPGLSIVAVKSTSDWSWTQRNSNFWNVSSLVASWFWNDPNIIDGAHALSEWPLKLFQFSMPVLVVFSTIFSKRLISKISAFLAVVFIVLSTGSNWPFASLNAFFVENIPGYWLFRQPMAKFGTFIVVLYAVIVALGVDEIMPRIISGARRTLRKNHSARPGDRALLFTWSFLVLGCLLFSYPLISGSVTPGNRSYLPSGRVELPGSWIKAGKWLNKDVSEGAVLVLPASEYYQRGTSWGFYGVDDIVTRVTDRPAVYPLLGGYYTSSGSVDGLIAAAEAALLVSDGQSLRKITATLGVDIVAVRTDVTKKWGKNRTFTDPLKMVAGARNTPGLKEVARFEHVVFYKFLDVRPTSLTKAVMEPEDPTDIPYVVAASGLSTAVMEDYGSKSYVWSPEGSGEYAIPTNKSVSVTPVVSGPLWWSASKNDGGIHILLESQLYLGDDPMIDVGPWDVPVKGEILAIKIAGSLIPFAGDTVTFQAAPSDEIVVLTKEEVTPTTDLTLFEKVGNCNNYNKETLAQSGIKAEQIENGVRVTAGSGSACLSADVPQLTSNTRLGWSVSFKWNVESSGPVGRVCLWLPRESKCIGDGMSNLYGSGTYERVVAVPPGYDTTESRIILYADAGERGRERAVVSYSDLTVSRVEEKDLPWKAPLVEPGEGRPAIGSSSVSVETAVSDNMATSIPTRVSDCHKYDDDSITEAGIKFRSFTNKDAQVLELSANSHSACVSIPVTMQDGIKTYVVSLSHRTVTGKGGRWCLISDKSGGCVASGSLGASSEWSSVVQNFSVSTSGFNRDEKWSLYLYADGYSKIERKTNTVQYTSVSVRPYFPVRAVIIEDGQPEINVVTNRESYAPGWVARTGGNEPGKVRVDGWANGWLVADRAADEISFYYKYDKLAAVGVWSLPLVWAVGMRSEVLLALKFALRTLTRVGRRKRGMR